MRRSGRHELAGSPARVERAALERARAGRIPHRLLAAATSASASPDHRDRRRLRRSERRGRPRRLRQQFGLPPCTTANGCFRKVDQNGGTSYPAANSGWDLEIALDVEIAHAICQNCKILLVEASSASVAALGTAVNDAVALGANVVSNSYGAAEFSSETGYDTYYNHPGVAITASSGDGGYGVEFPAASQYVTAVGGTTLTLNADKTYRGETAWSGAGSGCSLYEPKPAWQTDTGCSRRTVADVSADADPNSGAAIYDSYGYHGQGWFQVGGTSLAAPLVAAVYALSRNELQLPAAAVRAIRRRSTT